MAARRRTAPLLLTAVLIQGLVPPRDAFAANFTITVDANANRHAINPLVYGVAFGDATTLPDLNCPVNRWGGNATSNYNWQNNAGNRASDWYFQSIGGSSGTAGADADAFIAAAKAASAAPMMTIPMMDWVAKLVSPNSGNNGGRTWSFDTQKYGAQQQTAFDIPNGRAGNGVLTNGQPVTGNDPNDAYVPAGVAYQQGWVQHLVTRWGLAAAGGLKYYILDNEQGIWQSTHRDVHPVGPHDTEIRDKIIAYSAMIKSVDPGALVVGPEEWGWSGYLYSGFDLQKATWGNLPDHDQAGHGDYMPWLLAQLKQHDNANPGKPHTLDVFSLHYYPQGGEFGNDTSSAMQSTRNRSTRSLWDPSYADTSWIGAVVQLIPRMRNWVNTNYYPTTQIGITEYNWGAEGHINGATTQADVLGIFGREGLDLATYWTVPDPAGPTYKAFKMYRNYDGAKSTFGNTSVSAVAPSPDTLSAFAAQRTSDNALTIMVINKVTSVNSVTVALSNFSGGSAAQVWQLTSANQITRLADIPVASNTLNATVPAQSITLFVIPTSGTPPPPPPPQVGVWANATGNLANMPSECGNLTLLSAVPGSDTIIAGVAQKGLWASSNGGASWTHLGSGSGSDVITNRPSWITYDPAHPGTFWESGIYNGFGVYKTTDNGSTFHHLGSVTHSDYVSVDFSDPNRQTLIAGGHEQTQKVYRSVDGGQNWINVGLNLPASANFSSQPLLLNAQTHVVNTAGWGGGSSGIYRTANGGATWQQVSTQGPAGPPLKASDNTIYWPNGNGLLKSTDLGSSWTSVGSGLLWGVAPIELPDGRLVSVASTRLMISSDKGSSWSPIGPTLPALNPAPSGVVYSVNRKAFFIWHWDCGSVVLPDAIWRLDYDFGARTSSVCDVNGDGTTDVLDVQSEANQALGISSCTGDINQDSQCTVIDVQRVVNNALGGPCVTP